MDGFFSDLVSTPLILPIILFVSLTVVLMIACAIYRCYRHGGFVRGNVIYPTPRTAAATRRNGSNSLPGHGQIAPPPGPSQHQNSEFGPTSGFGHARGQPTGQLPGQVYGPEYYSGQGSASHGGQACPDHWRVCVPSYGEGQGTHFQSEQNYEPNHVFGQLQASVPQTDERTGLRTSPLPSPSNKKSPTPSAPPLDYTEYDPPPPYPGF